MFTPKKSGFFLCISLPTFPVTFFSLPAGKCIPFILSVVISDFSVFNIWLFPDEWRASFQSFDLDEIAACGAGLGYVYLVLIYI